MAGGAGARPRHLPRRQRRSEGSRRVAQPGWPPLAAAGVSTLMAAGSHPKVVVVEDAPALAEAAALRLIARVTGKDRAAICLTGGSSPAGLYRLLAEEPWRGQIPWDRVHWFIGDDRFVPQSDPLSNMGMARRIFIDRTGAPPANIPPRAPAARA